MRSEWSFQWPGNTEHLFGMINLCNREKLSKRKGETMKSSVVVNDF